MVQNPRSMARRELRRRPRSPKRAQGRGGVRAQWHEAADGRRGRGWVHHTEAVQHGARGSGARREPGTAQVAVVSVGGGGRAVAPGGRQKEICVLRHENKNLSDVPKTIEVIFDIDFWRTNIDFWGHGSCGPHSVSPNCHGRGSENRFLYSFYIRCSFFLLKNENKNLPSHSPTVRAIRTQWRL